MAKAKEKYVLRFLFDAGSGVCLWAKNDSAHQEFGYAIELRVLPLSDDLVVQGEKLIKMYDKSIDWNHPPDPTPWSEEEIARFNDLVRDFVVVLQTELGSDFTILDQFQLS